MVQLLCFPPCLSGISDVENKTDEVNGEGKTKAA